MIKEQLQNTLERLRAEITALGNDEGAVKDRLNSLISDLEQQIQNSGDADHKTTVRERLDQLIGQIESKHPVITGMLEQIADNLANIGI